MNGVERSDGFARKWLASALDHLRADTKQNPMPRNGRQVCSTICGFCLGQLAEHPSPM
ncbi:MAG TPA: hypothetical protein VN730_13095 [Steroidobacteraceae bacterium]|nr:hypothetical protein [Steroidobacteraceae bacterium]